MSDLVAFLLARLVEDEQAARAAQVETQGGEVYQLWAVQDWIELDADVLAHVDRHDPARVLADVAAKRRIVEWHEDHPDTRPTDRATECRTCGAADVHPCTTLRLLALPHADHEDYREDYREDWRPA